MRLRFYRPNTLSDSKKIVKQCDRCQNHVPIVRQPLEMLPSISFPNPSFYKRSRRTWSLSDHCNWSLYQVDWDQTFGQNELLSKRYNFNGKVWCRYELQCILVMNNGRKLSNKEFKKCSDNDMELCFVFNTHTSSRIVEFEVRTHIKDIKPQWNMTRTRILEIRQSSLHYDKVTVKK